jgi:hypothetical protein
MLSTVPAAEAATCSAEVKLCNSVHDYDTKGSMHAKRHNPLMQLVQCNPGQDRQGEGQEW